MAQVIWKEEASRKLEANIDFAMSEFGRKAVANWYKAIRSIEKRMEAHPESFTLEPLLKGRTHDYRGAILMQNFKLIHYYDIVEDVVYIVTVWDMRMSPSKLRQSIK